MTHFTARLPDFEVILIVSHRILSDNGIQRIDFAEKGETHLDHGEEDTGGAEGDLSWWNAASVLGDV